MDEALLKHWQEVKDKEFAEKHPQFMAWWSKHPDYDGIWSPSPRIIYKCAYYFDQYQAAKQIGAI